MSETTAAAPEIVPEAAPAVVVEPLAPAPVPETLAPAEPTAGSLIGDATAAEAPPAEPAKPADEAAPPAEPAKPEPFAFQPFTLPEGISPIAPEALKTFHELLNESGTLTPQEFGQRLIDRHVAEMQTYAATVAAEQQRVWADTRAGWVKAVKSDPELGGSGFETTMREIAQMRDQFVAPENMKAFNEFLHVTGAGDHPEMIRFMKSLAKRFAEPAPLNGVPFTPPRDVGKAPKGARGGWRETLYGS